MLEIRNSLVLLELVFRIFIEWDQSRAFTDGAICSPPTTQILWLLNPSLGESWGLIFFRLTGRNRHYFQSGLGARDCSHYHFRTLFPYPQVESLHVWADLSIEYSMESFYRSLVHSLWSSLPSRTLTYESALVSPDSQM